MHQLMIAADCSQDPPYLLTDACLFFSSKGGQADYFLKRTLPSTITKRTSEALAA
jgi:hypothetical protein